MKKKHVRKVLTMVLSLIMAVSLFAGCASQTSGSKVSFKEGTYVGEGKGNNGPIKVEVTFSKDAIKSIKVLEQKETAGLTDPVFEKIPTAIVEGQTLAVDAVSGATNASNGLIEAVKSCIQQAGGNVEALMVKKQKKTSSEVINKTADVIVIGGGGAGVSAAVAAAEKGSSVIVIEKTAALGGNTILAGGGFNGVDPERQSKQKMSPTQLETVKIIVNEKPKNKLHAELIAKVKAQLADYEAKKANYVFDSVEFHALQTYKGGDYLSDLELIYAFTKRASEGVKWLEDCGLVWKDDITTYVGALWPRSHEAKNYKSGKAFIETFTNMIKEKSLPIEMVMETKATDIVVTDGKVVGVTGKNVNGATYNFKAKKGVVLACGGFAANIEMCRKYKPNLLPNLKSTNSPANVGDGIIMASAIGANLVGMEQIQLLPTANPVTGGSPGYVGESAGMYINKEGKRFVNEYGRRDVLTKAVFEQKDGLFYIVTNQKNSLIDKDGKNKFGQDVEELIATKSVYKADTIENLAKQLNMDPAVLKNTVDTWNNACKTGVDKEFGRNVFAENVWLTEGPYYASPRQPSIHHTMGGVQVDVDTHVINKGGKIIKGLYAAGEVTGGIHGSNRLGANAVPDALVNGRVAGQMAATEK